MQRRFDILTEFVAADGEITARVNLPWANPRDFKLERVGVDGAFVIGDPVLTEQVDGRVRFEVTADRVVDVTGKSPPTRLAAVYVCETDEIADDDENAEIDFVKTWPALVEVSG